MKSQKSESDKGIKYSEKLKFKKDAFPDSEPGGRNKHAVKLTDAAESAAMEIIHRETDAGNEDENAGTQALNKGVRAAETGMHAVGREAYGSKSKPYDKAERLYVRTIKRDPKPKGLDPLEAAIAKDKAEASVSGSNLLSRLQRRRAIKREYAAALRAKLNAAESGGLSANGAGVLKGFGTKLTEIKGQISNWAGRHPMVVILIAVFALLLMIISVSLSSCAAILPGSTGAISAAAFMADDEDIIGVNDDYKKMEAKLSRDISRIETSHPGYDEYKYELAEIGHDPYELAAYLTVILGDYNSTDAKDEITRLFDMQYELKLEENVETRTRTLQSEYTDPETGEIKKTSHDEEYEYRILKVTLVNNDLGNVISASGGLTASQTERYELLKENKGSREELFTDESYVANSGTSEYANYNVSTEALTNTRFANMLREAEKYLGMPYVWGGSTPETSFDCSGFVSWVINHCGNGWSVGRQTANGLKNLCTVIPASEVKPGDLIFFQGTYNTSGASHVGIVVGNGLMIHAGNPISYTSYETQYYQEHFYCFGRIPG